jgi:catechol 2,3-dioxygenase
METEALVLAHTRSARNLPEGLSYGPVELSVTDLDRAPRFRTPVLRCVPRPEPGHGVALGTARTTLVVPHAGQRHPQPKATSANAMWPLACPRNWSSRP